MIDAARRRAEDEGLPANIVFVKGALEDLAAFNDHSFDLVVSFDAPISNTYPNQESVIRNLVRLARKKVMFSVTNRLGSLPYYSNPLNKNQFVLDENCDDPWVQWCLKSWDEAVNNFSFSKKLAVDALRSGLIMSSVEEAVEQYEKGEAPWVITYGFLPEELTGILRKYSVSNIRLAGPGAYARTVPREVLQKIMGDPEKKKDFLEFCYVYDSNPYVCGMGKDNLLAIGDVER